MADIFVTEGGMKAKSLLCAGRIISTKFNLKTK